MIENPIRSFVYYKHWRNISSRFSSSSEAIASELLENIEEMFPRYYMKSDMFSMFKPLTIQERVAHRKEGQIF